MEHFISLTVAEDDLLDELPRHWYKVAKNTIPEGLCTTFTVGEDQRLMKQTKKDGKAVLTIPLVRNLTQREVEKVIRVFDDTFKGDFSISSSRIQVGVKDEVPVEINMEPLMSLCTAWAKKQHNDWMKEKTDAGWRYGPSVSMANKTHPLLRAWNDLPDEYRKVDTSKPEELLNLFNEHGYVLIAKDELDQLLRDGDLN